MSPVNRHGFVFIINLTKDIEKKNHMYKLCREYGLDPIFVRAVEGQRLELGRSIGVYSKDAAISGVGRELSASEIGCSLSHKKIYQELVDGGIEKALILEDDVEFDDDLLAVLNRIEGFPKDWEVVLLGHHAGGSRNKTTLASMWGQKCLVGNSRLVRPCEVARGTYGYLINQKGARKLIEATYELVKPIDHYTGDSAYTNLYAINPPVIHIHEELSTEYSSMNGREALQGAMNEGEYSWKKRLAIRWKIYSFLTLIRLYFVGGYGRIKPIRKYSS